MPRYWNHLPPGLETGSARWVNHPGAVDAWVRAMQAHLRDMPSDPDAVAPFAQYLGREVEFAQNILHEKLWAFERETIEALARDHFVAVRASRKTSKTQLGADVLLTWLLTRKCVVITSAPGARQVKKQLWERVAEILSKARRHSSIPGKLSGSTYTIGPNHYAIGMSTDDPNAQQGWHAGVVVPDDPDKVLTQEELDDLGKRALAGETRSMLIIIDEACGFDDSLWDAIQGSLSGSNVYVLLLANPTRTFGDEHFFARAFKDGSGYHRVRVSSIPPEQDERDEAPYDKCYVTPRWLLDQKFIDRARREWKVGSPLWAAYVCGRFPAVDLEQVFISGPSMAAAEAGYLAGRQVDWALDRRPGRHVGVDIARAGRDASCASLVVDGVLAAQHTWRSTDLMVSAGVIASLTSAWGINGKPIAARDVHVDACGMGAGVCDRLKQMGLQIDAVDVGAKAIGDWKRLVGETKFANRKAELHWVVRRAIEEGLAVVPAKYHETRQQATWTRYEILERTSSGSVIAVHRDDDKDGLRLKYGRSPDHWDSYMLAFSRGRAAGTPGYAVMGHGGNTAAKVAKLLGRRV